MSLLTGKLLYICAEGWQFCIIGSRGGGALLVLTQNGITLIV